MLGSLQNSRPDPALDYLNAPPASKAAAKQPNKFDRALNELIRREWAELPYAMMRLTASRMSWDHNPLYWRDETVHLGEINLTLAKKRAHGYVALYSLEGKRRDFALSPSFEDDQLRWSAPGVSDHAQLTTQQLAEKLLSKLISFYTQGPQ